MKAEDKTDAIMKNSKQKNNPTMMPLKFAVDCMLGKLAKALRIMGYDTFYKSYIDDAKLVNIAYEENRIILTRDRELTKRKKAENFFYVEETNPKKQIEEVIVEFKLDEYKKPLTRCLVCNSKLKSVEKKSVKNKVPEYTYKKIDKFYQCSGCGKIYWSATHIESIKKIYNI